MGERLQSLCVRRQYVVMPDTPYGGSKAVSIDRSGDPPARHWQEYVERFGSYHWAQRCTRHALLESWRIMVRAKSLPILCGPSGGSSRGGDLKLVGDAA
jgi:hypothetical protein